MGAFGPKTIADRIRDKRRVVTMEKRVVIVPMERVKSNGSFLEVSEEESRLYVGVSALPGPNDENDSMEDIDAYITANPEFDLTHAVKKTEALDRITMLKLEMTTGEDDEVFVHSLDLSSAKLDSAVDGQSTKQFLVRYLFLGTYDTFHEYKLSSTIRMDAREEPEFVELAISRGGTLRQVVFKLRVYKASGVIVNLFDFFFHLNKQHIRLKLVTKSLEEDRAALKCRIDRNSQIFQNLQENFNLLKDNFSKKVPLLLNTKKMKIRQQWQEINALLSRLGEKPKYGVYDSRDPLRYDSIKDEDQLLQRVERRQQELGTRKRAAKDELHNQSPTKQGKRPDSVTPPPADTVLSTSAKSIKKEPLSSPVAKAEYKSVVGFSPPKGIRIEPPSSSMASPAPSAESDATDYSTGSDDDDIEVIETQPDSVISSTTDTLPDQ